MLRLILTLLATVLTLVKQVYEAVAVKEAKKNAQTLSVVARDRQLLHDALLRVRKPPTA